MLMLTVSPCGEMATLAVSVDTGLRPRLPLPPHTFFPTVDIAPVQNWPSGVIPQSASGMPALAFVAACGDLDGAGYWHFSQQGALTIVLCEWHVRTTRWWMNMLTPLARAIFIRNHARFMKQGGEGLARRLGVPLLSQESIELMSTPVPARAGIGRRQERARINSAMVLLVGIVAGVLAIAAQRALSTPTSTPKAERLLGDAHQNAARVLGTAVLGLPLSGKIGSFGVQTLMNADGLPQDSAKRALAVNLECRA